MTKEIDHILVSTDRRILQNRRIYCSAEFFATDHRLVAFLKTHVTSKRAPKCNLPRFHLEKLREPTFAIEYAIAVSNQFEVLSTLEDPGELWDTFKRETLKATEECVGQRPRFRSGVASEESLRTIEEGRAARLSGNLDQYRTLSRRTRALLRRDKETFVSALAEEDELR